MAARSPIASIWTRPQKPQRDQAGLSRDQIVRAAIEILDAEGRDALSMRRLGARLGAAATSVYWYVSNKDELLELALDEIFGEVERPDPETSGWRPAFTIAAHSLRSLILRHPWVAQLIGVYPMYGPNALRFTDHLVGVAQHAGFQDFDVDFAVTTVVAYVYGMTIGEAAWLSNAQRAGTTMKELDERVWDVSAEIARDYPRLSERYRAYGETDPQRLRVATFDFGLVSVLDGLELRRRATRRDPDPPAGT
ncbi:TetR/AcrR family transcriptional regulator C-terminal domain-containing protein [Bailinhaonella thermotolerans]|uniref:TetR/AcrR family transcriptional regulator n=1 Tax=Bailinhaonella thermotolerans TaxID=1070861 RepID=A0A3A4A772_9ACTN|nr:TetR/AcrR family transcriptional regulator C-terminal domain-containing protein [Bailinhaonella thermotolerans]RJL21719.1 TetR/AcrR family transcriptional regulator [Bailinhaonella thermotolerans]